MSRWRRQAPSLPAAIALVAALSACSGTGSPTASAASGSCPTSAPSPAGAAAITADAGQATIKTNKGSFTIRLAVNEAPVASANFVQLARCGFYDGITFHRVIPGFVIQAGDPQTRTRRDAFDELGTGGPGYGFAIEPPAATLGYDKYAVAMANTGQPDSNGSQFFVDLDDLDGRLGRDFTIFGKVTEGTAVVDAIGQVPTGASASGQVTDVPLDAVIIESITVAPASS